MPGLDNSSIQELTEVNKRARSERKSNAEKKAQDVVDELRRLERVEKHLKELVATCLMTENKEKIPDGIRSFAKRISQIQEYSFHKNGKK